LTGLIASIAGAPRAWLAKLFGFEPGDDDRIFRLDRAQPATGGM
jgi:hypothetical protein